MVIIYFQYNYLTPFVQKGVSKTVSPNIHILITITTSVRILLFFSPKEGIGLKIKTRKKKLNYRQK